MKTKLLSCIATIFLFSSCVESYYNDVEDTVDPSDISFTAVMDFTPQTRTSLSNQVNSNGAYSLNWMQGDLISVTDGERTAVFGTQDNNVASAKFTRKEGKIDNEAAQYIAFYPSSITMSNMVLPATQNYIGNNVEKFPMRAISADKNLAFKSLCGIMRFSIISEEEGLEGVTSISLSADKGMSGAFTVGEDNSAVVSGGDGVVLNCSTPQVLESANAKDFNIIVPAGEYNPLSVKIKDASGKEINLVSTSVVPVKRSGITRISLKLAKSSFDSTMETIPITDSDVDFTER